MARKGAPPARQAFAVDFWTRLPQSTLSPKEAPIRIRILAAVIAMGFTPLALAQAATGPKIPKFRTNCHRAGAGETFGHFESVASKSQSIPLKVDAATEIVRFDPKAIQVVEGGDARVAEAMYDMRKGHEAKIAYVEKDGNRTVTRIWFKGPIKIAFEKLVHYEDVAALVAKGPEAVDHVLVDSRPLPRVQEGTIPPSINLPFTTKGFDALAAEKLPADKARRIVFFRQGITCMLSPNSLLRAEAMGYTNARVYREGWPEWTQKNIGIIDGAHLEAAWIDKDVPHILVDARPAAQLRAGFIPGAVAITPERVKAALAKFPDKKLKPPVMVYDADGGKAAMAVATAILKAGYPNVTVIPGGFSAWKSAGRAVATGTPATTIANAPKPRPGDIGIEAFRRLALDTPADTVILDVRNNDEANAGMIEGAKQIPDEDILARLAEIPKDEGIVSYCSTGGRAEMTFHKLKDRGYQAAFVKADIEVDKNGKFTLAAN